MSVHRCSRVHPTCGTAERAGLVRSQDRNSTSRVNIRKVWVQPVLGVGKGGSDLALRWPSGASTPHQRAQPDSPRTHTTHTRHQTKGWLLALSVSNGFPSVWRAWRAREGYPAAPAARRGNPAGHLELWQSSCVNRVNRPRLSRSAKAQVLPERPRSSLYRRLPWPPFYTPLTVSSSTLAVTRTWPRKGAAVGNTVKRMKKMKSGALAVHVEAGLLSTPGCAWG